ncbi:seven-hairpin glycosidase [Meira miltonrushii]|uniref:alpha-1,2-Mannosidase n=1 Tax=Meira miltonrushii TaxID=1280837 RepID=A0A316V154_9BASI|nr:seven-hairpin glycosidase [Meira miltonrushii]PWN31279.1 seven-hairpin glycosidase [Meira miltonrushii]
MAGSARKRTGGGQKGAEKQENGSSKGANDDRNRKPAPSVKSSKGYTRILLKAFFGLAALISLALAVLPYFAHDGIQERGSIDRFKSLIFGSETLHNNAQSANVKGKGKQVKESTSDPSPEQSSPEENLGAYLRPSLPFEIDRKDDPEAIVRDADTERREAVRVAFQDSWLSYVEDAFGSDEYHPISRKGTNFSADGGVGYFIVDIIDMLLITGDQEGYNKARDWVQTLRWDDKSGKFSVFETTIRTLGGLLSAHALCTPGQEDSLSIRTSKLCSADDATMFLTKAADLAMRLKPAFESNRMGLPEREVDFRTGEVFSDIDNNNLTSLAELATIQLEFKFLAHATGDSQWWKLAERPIDVVRQASFTSNSDGLMPIFFNPQIGRPQMSEIRLGSRGDSYYEYLIKQFVQTNRTETVYLDMYQQAMRGVKKHLLRRSESGKFVHTIEIQPFMNYQTRKPGFRLNPKQDHLVCFLGGSFMLGALHVQQSLPFTEQTVLPYPPTSSDSFSNLAREDWSIGHELIKTCMETYTSTKTGLSPEIAMFRIQNDNYPGSEVDWYIKKPADYYKAHLKVKNKPPPTPLIDARNILRPETVESLFIAFHLTGDQQYREWGWEIFQAFERHTRLPKNKDGRRPAFASIRDVDAIPVEFEDRMETFWLAETLKYLYLLFDDQNGLRLDQWVLNTEAHPLPIFTPTFDTNVL